MCYACNKEEDLIFLEFYYLYKSMMMFLRIFKGWKSNI